MSLAFTAVARLVELLSAEMADFICTTAFQGQGIKQVLQEER
jgi:hypothetical protein